MGAGMWGTTFAQVLCDAGTPAVLWARSPELAETITTRHETPGYLPGIALTPELTPSADPARVLDGAGLVVLAVPAQSLRQNLGAWTRLIPPSVPLVSLIKGIELGTCDRMSQVIAEVTGAGAERIAVISGPNLAREIAQRQPAATVVACADDTVAKQLQQACHTPYFRPYTNPDVIGCELGGAVKNVIALAVGIAVGMGLGDNTRATLITRGLAEISRLGAALGADQHTLRHRGLGDRPRGGQQLQGRVHPLRRYPIELESTLYFCAAVALRALAASDQPVPLRIRLADTGPNLVLTIVDESRSGEMGDDERALLDEMGDHAGAHGGTANVTE